MYCEGLPHEVIAGAFGFWVHVVPESVERKNSGEATANILLPSADTAAPNALFKVFDVQLAPALVDAKIAPVEKGAPVNVAASNKVFPSADDAAELQYMEGRLFEVQVAPALVEVNTPPE
jgi:hypothetical protein